ncbi:MAG TPA: hypothetical protein VI462_18085 [Acidimicrobiia bacterium]
MDEAATIDDSFLRRYRELLDTEDEAFDALDHAFEDGDRRTFEDHLTRWRSAVERRHAFLDRHGFASVLAH